MKRGDGDHLSPSIGESWVSPCYLKRYDLWSSIRCFICEAVYVHYKYMWVFLTLDSSPLHISYSTLTWKLFSIYLPLYIFSAPSHYFTFWTGRARMDSGGGLHSRQKLRQLNGGIIGITRRRRGFCRWLRRCNQIHLMILCLFPLRYITLHYSLWDFPGDVWLRTYIVNDLLLSVVFESGDQGEVSSRIH